MADRSEQKHEQRVVAMVDGRRKFVKKRFSIDRSRDMVSVRGLCPISWPGESFLVIFI
jgi:hypothetical protein